MGCRLLWAIVVVGLCTTAIFRNLRWCTDLSIGNSWGGLAIPSTYISHRLGYFSNDARTAAKGPAHPVPSSPRA